MYANLNFLNVMGWSLDEIEGKHHSVFCDPNYTSNHEYQTFWEDLREGKVVSSEFKQINKFGKEVWLHSSYSSVKDHKGKIEKIINLAVDITDLKTRMANYEFQIDSIHGSHAVIEFDVDGIILSANDIFLKTMGYSLDEIKGLHHKTFVDSDYVSSTEYTDFWNTLKQGDFFVGEFCRINKKGEDVWLQASYIPVKNIDGQILKIIKYATNITHQKLVNTDFSAKIQAINKTQAVIEFCPDGAIITANDLFLNLMGYSIEEIQGQHHHIFVDQDEVKSEEYEEFWNILRSGVYQARIYKRLTKEKTPVWIQASYNPIIDNRGKVVKIVKYANSIDHLIKISEIVEQNLLNSENVTDMLNQMTFAIETINKNMNLSSIAVNEIKNDVQRSNKESDDLILNIQSMESVIDLINAVASQVNLLSINAAIEAARAGERGQGFGVVASEVKDLANQITLATSEIVKKIKNMRLSGQVVATNFQNIAKAATTVSNLIEDLALSVDRQTVSTQDLSRSNTLVFSSMKTIASGMRTMIHVEGNI